MLFVGDDWAEAHHDIEVQDDQGRVLARRRLPEGLDGMARLHQLLAERACQDFCVSVMWVTVRVTGRG